MKDDKESTMRKDLEQISGKTPPVSSDREVEEIRQKKRRVGRPPRKLIDASEGENHNWARDAVLEMIEKDCMTGEGFSGVKDSCVKNPFQRPAEKRLKPIMDQKKSAGRTPKLNGKNRLGRPPRKAVKERDESGKEIAMKPRKLHWKKRAAKERDESVKETALKPRKMHWKKRAAMERQESVKEIAMKGRPRKAVKERYESLKEIAMKGRPQKPVKESDESLKEIVSEICIERSMSKKIPPKTLGLEDAVRGETSIGSDMDCVTNDAANVVKDQPVLTSLDGMNAPSVDGSSLLGKTVNSCTEASERQDGTTASPAIAASCEGRVDKNPSFTFIRCSPLWESIESMEVFKIFPQKPHFHPLVNCKEESREGLAIGNMVTFANMVRAVSKLQFGDSTTLINGCLETLLELETHGFNVQPVKERVNELLSKEERRAQLEEDLKQVEREISNQIMERTEINGVIRNIDEQMTVLREELALAMSKRKMNDAKIAELAKLKTDLDVNNETLKKVQFEFENLAALPLDCPSGI